MAAIVQKWSRSPSVYIRGVDRVEANWAAMLVRSLSELAYLLNSKRAEAKRVLWIRRFTERMRSPSPPVTQDARA